MPILISRWKPIRRFQNQFTNGFGKFLSYLKLNWRFGSTYVGWNQLPLVKISVEIRDSFDNYLYDVEFEILTYRGVGGSKWVKILKVFANIWRQVVFIYFFLDVKFQICFNLVFYSIKYTKFTLIHRFVSMGTYWKGFACIRTFRSG